MKQRYIVRTYIEASSPAEALKLAKKTTPHEVFLDMEVWKERAWALRPSESKPLGFQK